MERMGGEGEGQRTSLWQVIGASVIGTVMEWYDFFIYAAAALVFPEEEVMKESVGLQQASPAQGRR